MHTLNPLSGGSSSTLEPSKNFPRVIDPDTPILNRDPAALQDPKIKAYMYVAPELIRSQIGAGASLWIGVDSLKKQIITIYYRENL